MIEILNRFLFLLSISELRVTLYYRILLYNKNCGFLEQIRLGNDIAIFFNRNNHEKVLAKRFNTCIFKCLFVETRQSGQH